MQLESDIFEYFGQYSDNIFRVARPVARQIYRANQRAVVDELGWSEWDPRPEEVVLNEMLGSTSKAILRLAPQLYLKWFRSALLLGLHHLLEYVWIVAPALLVPLSLPVLILRQRAGAEPLETFRSEGTRAVLALFIVAVTYFATYLVLVSVVSFPVPNYFVSMTLFLPSAICVQLFEIWRRIVALRDDSDFGSQTGGTGEALIEGPQRRLK